MICSALQAPYSYPSVVLQYHCNYGRGWESIGTFVVKGKHVPVCTTNTLGNRGKAPCPSHSPLVHTDDVGPRAGLKERNISCPYPCHYTDYTNLIHFHSEREVY